MNFEAVFKLIIENFEKEKINFALIGGFALHTVGCQRATNDIDFLVAKEDMPKAKKLMLAYGYRAINETEDVTNFLNDLGPLGQVDFLHAYRKYAKAMLGRATPKSVLDGKVKIKVIAPEDLIGLKVQSSSNDPNRLNLDMSDIENVLRANRGQLDLQLIKEYFDLFNRKSDLEKILGKLNEAK